MSTARLIIDKHGGPMNMAVDEALLLFTPVSGPTLRFYQWREPTLSLGYFQNAAERILHEASASCPMVRRSTGGGAILHDQELTYSFVVPVRPQDKSGAQPLYYSFHETLVLALEQLDVQAALFPADPRVQIVPAEPFLCFERRTGGDVILDHHKICGSAQRRQKDALLQHGSVLLQRSSFAPELGGINDYSSRNITPEALSETWMAILERRLKLSFRREVLNPIELATAERLAEDRFGTDSWSLRR